MEYFITMNIPNVEISPSKIGKEGVMPHIADYTSIASHPLAIKAVQLMASDPPMFIPKQAEYLLHAITHKDPKSTCSLNTEHEVTSFMGKVFNTIFEALGNRIISSLSNQQALCSSNDKTNSFKDGGLYFTDDEGRQITLMNFEVGIAPNDKKYPQMIATCIKDAHNSHHQNTASTNLIIILEKIKERRNKNDPIYTIKEIGFFVGHFYQKVFQINPLYNSKKILDEKEILIAFSKIINTLNQLSTFSKENCKLFYSSKKLGKDTLCYSLCEGGKEVKKVTKVIERKKSEDPKIEGGVSYVYASSIGATKLGNVKCLVTPRFYLVTHDYIEASNIPKYLSQVIECVKQVQVLCEKGIAHGELTPKNFLFSEEGSTITGFGEFNNNPVVDCNSIGLLLSMMNSPLKNQEIQDLAKEMKNCRDRRMCVGYYSKLYKLQGREKILLHQENTQEGKYFWGNFFHDPQLSYHLERYDHITNSSCVPIDFNGQEIDSDFCFEKKTQISSLLKIYSSPYDEEKEKLVKFIKEKSEDPKFSKFLIKRRVSCGKEVCGVGECKNGLDVNFMCKEHNYDFTEHYNSIFKTLKHEFTTIYDGKKTLIHFLFHQLGE